MSNIRILVFSLTLVLTACGTDQEIAVETPVKPVKTIIVGSSSASGIRHFPGRVEASQRADVSFRVRGEINEILVKEGDRVTKGQILAKLDDTDYQLVVNDKRALFNRARADFERAEKLVKKGFISRMDYDRLEAEYRSRKADLNLALRDLNYTILKAPFDAVVAQRKVDEFEEVMPLQAVFTLQDNDALEIKVDVPEKIIRSFKPRKTNEPSHVRVWASFKNMLKKTFPLQLKEISTKADPDTQTFTATFIMPAPEGFTLLPGMTVDVIADLSEQLDSKQVFYLPISAVTADAKLQSRVWVVDERSMTVKPLEVKLGQMTNNKIAITEGLKGGERIVTAGAAYLAEGMKVSLLETSEQAEPRPEDMRLSLGL